MNTRAQPPTEAADKKRSFVLYSAEDGGRVPRIEKAGIIELGVCSIRKFFEHPMATYAAALAYRGLFGLFPFLLLLVVLVGALEFPDFFDRAMDHARSESPQHVPQQFEPVIERGRDQIQPLVRIVDQAQKRANAEFLIFGVALALWSVSALARTLTEAFNAAYEVPESRRWWKVLLLSLAFGPVLALIVIVSVGLMLIGPQVAEQVAQLVGLADTFVSLWTWLRFPVALSLLAAVLSVVYRYGPDARQRFRSVVVGAALAVVLWAITSVGFSFYLANFANYGVTYGSLGAAVGLLFYLYLSASVVLVGAEVNAVIYRSVPDARIRAEESSLDTETTDAQGGREHA
jgi:membrane protein